jgi:hypothetical protein
VHDAFGECSTEVRVRRVRCWSNDVDEHPPMAPTSMTLAGSEALANRGLATSTKTRSTARLRHRPLRLAHRPRQSSTFGGESSRAGRLAWRKLLLWTKSMASPRRAPSPCPPLRPARRLCSGIISLQAAGLPVS